VASALVPFASSRTQQPDSAGAARLTGLTLTGAGVITLDVADLNARLARTALPHVASSAAMAGLRAELRVGRLVIGGGWQTILPRTTTSDDYRARSSGDMASLDAGAILVRGPRGAIFSLAGVGATHLAIRIDRRGDFRFDDGLAHPERGMEITGTTFQYHAGFGAEWRPSTRSALLLTARAGLLRGLGDQRWSAGPESVAGGPNARRGSYLVVGIARPLDRPRNALLPMAGAMLRMAGR
jgi:hypothetical protein